ncbi:MAG: type IV toxin-antitoxin system AbiEi family antitoxin domain-containing protein [Pseudomonadota bacterium]
MTSIKINRLPKKPFSYQEALKTGLTEHALRKLLEQGTIERISRGVYQLSEQSEGSEDDQYAAATLRCDLPSSVCLLSALDHYHLTDQIPRKTWMLVPDSKRIRANELRLMRSRSPKWDIGIKKTKSYWITTIERTLIDCLVYKQIVGSQVALSALKKAVSQKKIKLGKLYDVAKKMKVEHRIRSYIEALT